MIYMDNAATTRLDPRVLDAMMPYIKEEFYNPSTVYAKKVSRAIDDARETVASFVSCEPDGVIFTSGGTEADNLAIAGVVRNAPRSTKSRIHILTSQIEHKAVLETCRHLDAEGLSVTHYLKPDETGFVSCLDIDAMLDIDPSIGLVSIMAVNNEIGTAQNLRQIGKYCRNCGHHVIFHSDAVQAIHAYRINMESENVDMLSMSAHKFNGPKGVGALCVRGDAIDSLSPILRGGGQQRGWRPGTENVPGIIGMAKAIQLLESEWDARKQKVERLDNMMRLLLYSQITDVRINGKHPSDGGTYGYISLSIKDVDAETLLILLAKSGVYASSGSACNTGIVDVSHVLQAIDVPKEYISGTLRLTLSADNTDEDIITASNTIKEIVDRLRKGDTP